jgi:broad specificity phosphatase PhoE
MEPPMRRLALLFALLFAFATDAAAGIGPPDTVVVVVRHAEKGTDDPKDPSLSAEGQARAQRLAVALKDLPLTAVVASQFRRTQQTAQPAAQAQGLEVKVKPIGDSVAFARELAHHIRQDHAGHALLVVGHSNTVPDVVEALTGTKPAPIADDEFDRIYVVTLPADGKARFVVLRY